MKSEEYKERGVVVDRAMELALNGFNDYRTWMLFGSELMFEECGGSDRVVFWNICRGGLIERVVRIYPKDLFTFGGMRVEGNRVYGNEN